MQIPNIANLQQLNCQCLTFSFILCDSKLNVRVFGRFEYFILGFLEIVFHFKARHVIIIFQ